MPRFSAIMSNTDVLAEERTIDMLKKELLLKKRGFEIKQAPGDRGRYWIRYEGRMLKRTKKEDLVEELYAMVFETVTLSRFWDSYEKERAAVVSERTLYRIRHLHDRFIKGSEIEGIPVDQITIGDIKGWTRYCKEVMPDLTVSYFREIRSQLTGFAKWAAEERGLDTSVVTSYKPDMRIFARPKKTPEEDAIFTAEEMATVCEEARKDAWKHKKSVALAIPLLFATGMRRGEALALKWEDIKAAGDGTGTISISKQLVKDTTLHIIPRAKTTSGERVIRVRGDVLELFRDIRAINRFKGCPTEDGDYIFMRKSGGEWMLHDLGTPYKYAERYCKRAGMDKTKSPHDIRRTAITMMYRAGMHIKAIQKYAGHASVQQTYAYLRLDEEDVDIDLLPRVVTNGNTETGQETAEEAFKTGTNGEKAL